MSWLRAFNFSGSWLEALQPLTFGFLDSPPTLSGGDRMDRMTVGSLRFKIPPQKKKRHVTCFVWSVEQGRATDWRQLHFKLYVESSSAGRLVALTLAGSASVIKAFTLPCLISNYLRRFRPIWLLFQLGRQPKTQIGLGAMQSHSHVGKNVQLTKTPPPLAWNNHARWKTKHPCPILCFSKGKLLPFFRGVRFKIRYCIPKQQNLKGCYLLQEDSVT